MTSWEKHLKTLEEASQSTIDLSSIENIEVQEKAAEIWEIYKGIEEDPEKKLKGTDYATVGSMIPILKNITQNPEIKKGKITIKPILEASILAFDTKTGLFPEGFNPKTGKFE